MTVPVVIRSFGLNRQRLPVVGAMILAGLLLAQPAIFANRRLLLWNATDSAPIGLYAIERRKDFQVDDYAVIILPTRWRRFAAKRGYLPLGIPLVKRVAAVEGSEICSTRDKVTVDRLDLATRLARDGKGRSLPSWQGCRRLGLGQIFLLNGSRPNSFDSRYFGALRSQDAIGQGYLLWAA